MIRKAWRRAVRFLGSPGVATWLLVLVGVWSMVATLVPQDNAPEKVASWAAARPLIEPAVRALGLHHAFTSTVFRVLVLALALSTALCAWRRTKVAIIRMRTLRKAAEADQQWLSAHRDLEITCDLALSASDAVSKATQALEHLGIKAKRDGGRITAVSPAWAVLGSPVFHWGLLALIVVVLVASLQRSSGLMGVAVGETKADAPASYKLLRAGPLHDWSDVHRSIRVDTFTPDYRTGKIDRGPTPTVSVLDGSGRVVKTQLVYPNMPLRAGSLTIHPADHGLSAMITLLNAAGTETGRSVRLVDFSQETTGGTVPVEPVSVLDEAGNALLNIYVVVPLDRSGVTYVNAIPKDPRIRAIVIDPEGKPVLDQVIRQGEETVLPTGDRLRLDTVGWYARLNVVDDKTTVFLYAALAVAMVGLTLTLVTRQQIVVADVYEGPGGAKIAATVRLWRNVPTNLEEIESELTKTLGPAEKETTL